MRETDRQRQTDRQIDRVRQIDRQTDKERLGEEFKEMGEEGERERPSVAYANSNRVYPNYRSQYINQSNRVMFQVPDQKAPGTPRPRVS